MTPEERLCENQAQKGFQGRANEHTTATSPADVRLSRRRTELTTGRGNGRPGVLDQGRAAGMAYRWGQIRERMEGEQAGTGPPDGCFGIPLPREPRGVGATARMTIRLPSSFCPRGLSALRGGPRLS